MDPVTFDRVSKTYKKGFRAKKVPAVVDLSFAIPANSIVGFAGPNGAGKTTTIKMLLGLVHATSGRILVHGNQVPRPGSRRKLAYISEQPYFYDHLTARESLILTDKLLKGAAHDRAARLERIFDEIGLTGLENRPVKELSKGTQQRLSLGQALLGDADLFVFDEPMSGLDPPGRTLFRRVFRSIVNQGKTIFFSTHILDDIELLCDRGSVLSRGKLVYNSTVDDLLARGDDGFLVTLRPVSGLDRLADLGCHVETGRQQVIIHVPVGRSIEEVQRFLVERDIFPVMITKKKKSLESLLYDTP